MIRARLALVFLLALLALGLWLSRSPMPRKISPHGGDVVLFQSVVERMRAGEPYYAAMRVELLARGYPTASLFNWRPPATFLLAARAPAVAHGLMLMLAGLALILTVAIFRNASAHIMIAAVLFALLAVVLPAVPREVVLLPETWTGVFLLLSVLGYSLGGVRFGVLCALAAICARELALPYVLGCLALAWQSRRFNEIRWYAVGLAVFCAYYLAHVWMAQAHIHPGDMYHTNSWIAFGGWRFLMRTFAAAGVYPLLPFWTAAVGLVLVVASLWSPADRHLKTVVITYVVAFMVVGQSFNSYWGFMTGPTWGLAAVYGLLGLNRLVRESLTSSNVAVERV